MIFYLFLFFYFPENLILIFSCYFIHCICTAFGLNIMDSILGIFLLISFGWWLTFLNGGKFCLIPVIRQFSMLLPIIFFFEKHVGNFYYADRKLLSSITKLVASQIHNGCPLTIFGVHTRILPIWRVCPQQYYHYTWHVRRKHFPSLRLGAASPQLCDQRQPGKVNPIWGVCI